MVALWRARIAVALGPIARVLIDIIPSIELIIGPQPEVPPLAGEQALNRLNVVFGNFLKAVCTAESPLVVFIDDWQWADAGSLSLLKSVTADKDIGHLLLIGAYRDNEVDPTHPMAIALSEVRKGDTAISDIDVLPLRPVDVDDLVRDTLGHPPDAETVSRLLHDKTQGNAFFLVQLLTDLYEQSKLSFDLDQWRWIWRREDIEGHAITDNVVDLMAARIGRLPAGVQQTLIHAACIGDRFELSTLAAILGKAPHRTADDLETALKEGILLPVGLNHRIARQENNTANVSYKFVHDRVRQAAYGMLAGAAAEKIHHGIALKWLDELSADEQERQIFEIANQYNAGRRLITGDADRKRLIVINLQAGRRAKSATAYPTALQYFRTAFELSPAEAWASLPQETAELHLLAAEVAFLTKDYNAMEGWVDAYLDHRHAPLDRVAAYKIRLQAYVAQNRLSEAVDAGLHALGLLGVSLPREPTNADVAKELTRTLDLLQDKSLADLGELPAMRDPIHLAAMDLLGLVLPPAYWTSQELLGLVVCRMTQLSVTHGHSPNAGYGFSWWGILQCAVLGNIQSGFEFGEFAVELSKRHGLKLQQPLFFVAWILRKFRRHLSETIPLFEQTYALALEKGDFEYASYARNNHMQSLFHLGHELGGLLEEMDRAHRDLLRFQLGSSLYWHDIWWQTAWTFVNPTAKPHVLAGPAYDEAASLSQHLEVKDISTLFLLHVAKLLLACFFDDPGAALGCAKQARANLPGGVGTHAFVLFHFYESLALLTNRETEDTTAVDAQVAENQDRLKVWADNAPMNYRHHWLLVEAERQRVAGRVEEATQLYDQAIDQAHAGGFLHEEAFAHERAARAFIQRGLDRSGSFYLREALSLYERWGATAKAARLRAELSGPGQSVLMTNEGWSTIKRRAQSDSGSQRHGDFDLLAVTQASQAISREIVIDNMITTLLRILIEHSGAQKAVLVLKDGADLVIRAQGRAGDTIEIDTNPIPINDGDALPLPLSLIHLVARTGKCQVIHDARVGTLFGHDPYFVEVRPLSVLGQPIAHQGKLVGVLYLENNLTAGAFTEERLELLQLVSAQAAISIENARLFEEQRRLADSFARFVPREFLSLLNKESILDIVLGDGVEKEMTVLFSDIRSFTAVIEALSTRESFQFINEYLSYMEPVILSHGGFVNQYIGDAIMALFAVEPQQALEAAVGMTTAVARYNAVREARGDQPIRLGIGLHTGMLMLGTIGGAKRLDCGVISDTVNTAARLETMTKLFGATLIISDDLLRRTREPQKFATRVVGRIVVKGKTRPVTVIEVIDADLPERRAKKLATKAAFDRALERYVAGDFAQALTGFGQCRQQDPDDKAAAEYMHRCRALIDQPPALPWEGLVHLETK